MSRTTFTRVNQIMDTALEAKEVLPFIDQANRVVTTILGTSALTAKELEDIETWLAAHFIVIGKERQAIEERVDDIWLKYAQEPQEFLRSSKYGQMAMFLDTTGLLQKSSMKQASFKAIKQDND